MAAQRRSQNRNPPNPHHQVKNPRSQGFTLIEALLTVALFSVMLGGIYTAFLTGSNSWQRYSVVLNQHQQARRALTAIATELRQASDIFIVRDKEGIRVRFHRPLSGDVQYVWRKTGDTKYQIIRVNYSHSWIMAGGITAFDLSSPSSKTAFVQVTSGTETPFTLKETIALRAKTPMFRTFNE